MTNEERDALLKEIATDVNDIKGQVGLNNDKVMRHDKTLYGNGRPGLCERLQRVEDSSEGRRSSVAAVIAWIGAIAALAGAAGTLVVIITH